MTLGDIISQYRKDHAMSMDKFSKASGISKAYISMLEKNRTQRGEEPVPSIEMYRNVAEVIGVNVDELVRMVDGKVLLPQRVPSASSSHSGIKIPVLGDVAAGLPIEAVENIVDYEEIDQAMAASGEHFGLRLKGDSMEPRMKDGDVVIVRKQDDVENGDIAVVLVNGDSATVKRIKKGPSGITLIPNNPAYDPMFYTCDEIAQLPVRILGKVVELRGKF